ncbi:MAG: hypothetical protein NTY96_11615 [Bacteroidetes bacterium]|nr:hypothetical protein [Bacteroidota bacterium]
MIPLQKGNFWKYRGSYNDKPVTCNIVVNDILKKGNLTFALMKGFPSDILGGEDWETTSWGLLAVGNEHYYKVSGPRIDSIRTIMLNEKSVQSCLVTDSDLFMEALNDTGQTFGEAAQLTRNDGNYFWRVTQKHAYEPSSIKGLKLMGPFDRFTLNYQTVADDITLDIVPGIGIVRYRYCHHGTPGELDMKLVDVGIQ